MNPYVSRAELPFHLPILVLYAEIQNPNITFQFLGTGTVEGKLAIHIHVADNSDSTGQLVTGQEWYFDPVSFLPVRVEYKWPDQGNPSDSTFGALEFSNFKALSGVNVPYQLKIQVGQLTLQATVTSVTFNSGVPASTFDPPDLTGVFCTSWSEREFTLEGSWYADEEIQAGADCDATAAG